ncbi:hypothetical protein SLEP1_g45495 [Rubroshorea leprosula]|uniref:RNase H type-1 domain-containing protein n=1 Tax=Rubroshorea leprosula TaxID=152421 RepID=A0AAV5LK03_9ROSI|nr:hypothetical protein SLEP1_g45495 [Rubroshorea leprosula]
MPRNLFVGGAEQDHLSETDDERTPTGYATQPEQFQAPTGTRQRSARPNNAQRERPERSTEPARTTELEERTRVLEMAIGRILARLIPDDPLIPLLNRDAQPAAVMATRNSPALSNIVVPTRPRGSGKLNIEPSSSKYSEELMRKNADLERQLRDVQKSIDELKSPRSHQQTLDLDSAPLNLSITAEPYQEGFKIPHLETYDGTKDPDEHLHTYQAIMRIQNANDAMMCKVFPATLKSTARRWYHKLPRHSIDSFSQLAKLFSNKFASQREIKRTATELMQVNQKEGESLRDYMQRFNKATLDIDNIPDTICLSALLHGLKRGRFLDDLLENPLKTWNDVERTEAISSVLLREENKNQKPICYVSKVLQGAEQNYPLAEKAAFALVYTARKLRAYFQSHQIVVYTDFPLRKILQKPELSGRLIGWSIELSEYDLKFQPRTTIKGQAVADFLVECASATVKDKAPENPLWVLYVDGAANVEGSGAGAVLLGPDGFKSEHALRFKFQTTNNAAEYEALIYGLKLADELKVQSVQVFSDSQLVVRQVNGNCDIRDPQLGRYASVVNTLKSRFASFQIDKIPRTDNQRADELSKLASSQDVNPQRSTIVEVLDAPSYTDFTIECQLLSTDHSISSWTTPLMNYLQSGELPEDHSAAKMIKRRAAHFTVLDNQLYKRAASMPLLRCLTPYEAEYAVREVHEGVCGTHIGGRTLARKLLRHGYYWPTMVEDAQDYVKKSGRHIDELIGWHTARELICDESLLLTTITNPN